LEYIYKFRDNHTVGELAKVDEIIGKLSTILSLFEEKGWSYPDLHFLVESNLKYLISMRDKKALDSV
jgi:hypothetical protein